MMQYPIYKDQRSGLDTSTLGLFFHLSHHFLGRSKLKVGDVCVCVCVCVCVIKLLVYVNICSSFVSLHTKACFLYRISHNCSTWNYVRAAGNFCRTKVAMRVVVHLEHTRTHTFVHCHPWYLFFFAALAQLCLEATASHGTCFLLKALLRPETNNIVIFRHIDDIPGKIVGWRSICCWIARCVTVWHERMYKYER